MRLWGVACCAYCDIEFEVHPRDSYRGDLRCKDREDCADRVQRNAKHKAARTWVAPA